MLYSFARQTLPDFLAECGSLLSSKGRCGSPLALQGRFKILLGCAWVGAMEFRCHALSLQFRTAQSGIAYFDIGSG